MTDETSDEAVTAEQWDEMHDRHIDELGLAGLWDSEQLSHALMGLTIAQDVLDAITRRGEEPAEAYPGRQWPEAEARELVSRARHLLATTLSQMADPRVAGTPDEVLGMHIEMREDVRGPVPDRAPDRRTTVAGAIRPADVPPDSP